jgi:DNA repair ATPase RecN
MVSTLEGDGVIGELVRMLGGEADDSAAGDHARELLRAA